MAAVIVATILAAMVLPLLTPLIAEAASPNQPTNVSPANGTTEIGLTHTFQSSAFSDTDAGDTHYASRWQISTTSGDYSSPVFDSGVDTTNKTTITIPYGTLGTNTVYYWHVRHTDNTGEWSSWSTETSFTTIVSATPITPINGLPANGNTGIAVTPTLQSSPFAAPDGEATHAASQWQISTTSGDYTSPVYDSGTDSTNKTSITIASGVLSYNTTYYWHVRHRDSYGNWSAYSTETSFTTVASGVPSTPSNISPVNGADPVTLTPTLKSSAFSDPDVGDTHAASQWQISTILGEYSGPVLDSGIDGSNLTEMSVSSGILSSGTKFYWHVRHQDDKGNWSAWSTETLFTTVATLPPNQPANISPTGGTTDIDLLPTLSSSAFSDPDAGDSHAASRWQVSRAAGDYTSPVFDSGLDTTNLTQISIPSGYLKYDTTYYWHVKYQDSSGNWSAWSMETSFTTVATLPPNQPANVSPAAGASGAILTPKVQSSAFSDPDAGDTHAASQWQTTTTSGDYSAPVYDSGVSTSALTEVTISSGTLSYDTTYYWHVRHRDSYGNWSAYSAETSFATVTSLSPRTPTASSPADKATDVSLAPTLQSSTFSDPDAGDTHAASQWQVSITSGDYTSPVFDSGTDSSNKTSVAIPADTLGYGTKYYWHVRHRDSYGNWSAYSTEASFTTFTSQAAFSATATQVTEGQTVTFTDSSTGGVTSWTWDFGDGVTAEWTTGTRPADGKITHAYTSLGNYTVSLKVNGPAGEDTETKANYIVVSVPVLPGPTLWWIWIVVIVAIGVVIGAIILKFIFA